MSRTDELGRTTTRTYDDLGRLATVADPSGRAVTFGYYPDGRVQTATHAAGTWGPAETVGFGYDALGRRTSMVDSTGTTTWAWDPVGHLTGYSSKGNTLAFGYDDAGNRTSMTYPDASVASFSFDGNRRLTGLSHPAGGAVSYGYDDDGRLLHESLPESVTRDYGWTLGRLASYTETRDGTARTTTLGYDAADRITSETTGDAIASYAYDPAGQLDLVTRGSDETDYEYDAVGNRDWVTTGSTKIDYGYDDAQQLSTATKTVNGLPVGTVSFSYDGAGRMTGAGSLGAHRTLTYSGRGDLSQVSDVRGLQTWTTDRVTDADGKLVSATSAAPLGSPVTTSLTWDPSAAVPQIAWMTATSSTTQFLYGMGRAMAIRGSQSDVFAQDVHGSTLAEGAAADLARSTGYDEYGTPATTPSQTLLDEILGITSPGTEQSTLLGYRGEAHLNGLVHLRARDYAPRLGALTSVDPLDGLPGEVAAANAYHYGNNDPLNQIDPLGLRPVTDAELKRSITETQMLPCAAAGRGGLVTGPGTGDAMSAPSPVAELGRRISTPIAPDLGTGVEVLPPAAGGPVVNIMADVSPAPETLVTPDPGPRCGVQVTPPAIIGRIRVIDAAEEGGGIPQFIPGSATGKVPSDWGTGTATQKGGGWRWTDPTNQGNGVRIDPGNPDSSLPSQQVDHVVVRSGGKILGPDGQPINGPLSQNPQAHIPLKQWQQWQTWNQP